MPINPLLSLQVKNLDTATPLAELNQGIRQDRLDAQAAKIQQKQSDVLDANMVKSKIDAMDAEEKSRLQGGAIFAAQTKDLAAKGDFAAIESIYKQRKGTLAKYGKDSNETDELYELYKQDPKKGVELADTLVKTAVMGGVLQEPKTDLAAFNANLELQKFEETKRSNLAKESATRARLAAGGATVDPDTGEIIPGKPKPKTLPVGALRLQDEVKQSLAGAKAVQDEAKRLLGQLEKGELDVGFFRNLESEARNKIGASDTVSQNYADLDTTLEKIRNESLRLNKGVQTEGDSERAMNEVIKNRNDPKLLKMSLEKLYRLNERAEILQQERLDDIKQNYGIEEDSKAPTTQKPPPANITPEMARAELERRKKL